MGEGGKKMGSGRTQAGNSDKLSVKGRARAWASRAKAGLGLKFEARAGLYSSLFITAHGVPQGARLFSERIVKLYLSFINMIKLN